MAKHKVLLVSTAIILILLGGVAGLYLFRTERFETKGLGDISVTYRWGRAIRIDADRNQDGNVDAKYLLLDGDPTNPPLEAWIDPAFSGCFSHHSTRDNEGLLRLEVDLDCDDTIDLVFHGPEAEEQLKPLGAWSPSSVMDRTIPNRRGADDPNGS